MIVRWSYTEGMLENMQKPNHDEYFFRSHRVKFLHTYDKLRDMPR